MEVKVIEGLGTTIDVLSLQPVVDVQYTNVFRGHIIKRGAPRRRQSGAVRLEWTDSDEY